MSDNEEPDGATTISEFSTDVEGAVLRPGDKGYEEARSVWNAMFDRRPTIVVQPETVGDVARSVEIARDHDLPIAVQGGGHNVAGHGSCEAGLLIDCSSMSDVSVDPEALTARAEPGVTIGDFDQATQVHGLATPGGIVSTTGLAGLTLGGGWGWLSRSYGLTIDNLRSVEIVTADGSIRSASEQKHADLFWAIRGGGGNFGIVTEFEFELHEVGPLILGGVLVFPFEVAGDLLRFHRDFTAYAPRELCCYASVRTAPDVSFLPEDIRGEKIATAYLCYHGDIDDGADLIEPLKEFHPPIVDTIQPQPYSKLQQFFDDVYPPEFRNYWKSQFVGSDGLPNEAIDTLVSVASDIPSPYTSIVIEHLGGAITDHARTETAFPHREAGYAFNIFTRWDDAGEDEHQIKWTQDFFAAMVPYLTDGVYVNFLSKESDDRVKEAFRENYARLRAVKRKYDAENLFKFNQNVNPG